MFQIRTAVPDLVPKSYFPAVAAVKCGTRPGVQLLLTPLTYDAETWRQERVASIDARSLPQAATATWVARHAEAYPDAAAEPAIEDKDAEPDAEQHWQGGRDGTAFGSAVHVVLQCAVGEMTPRLPADDPTLVAAGRYH